MVLDSTSPIWFCPLSVCQKHPINDSASAVLNAAQRHPAQKYVHFGETPPEQKHL